MISKGKLRSLKAELSRLAGNEDGGEVVEWVLVVGVVACICIFTATMFGKALGRGWDYAMSVL